MMRCLFFIKAKFNFIITAKHIPAAYITIRGANDDLFFVLESQIPLTREQFIKMTKENSQQQESIPVVTLGTASGSEWPTASACGV